MFFAASACLAALTAAVPALADEAGPSAALDGRSTAASADAEAKPGPRVRRKSAKGKRIREKEAEGTEAPDRFQADTVIKSKYELNGVPLEVDPD